MGSGKQSMLLRVRPLHSCAPTRRARTLTLRPGRLSQMRGMESSLLIGLVTVWDWRYEHPYLNGANSEKLKIGEVVTNEPGIYVTGEEAKGLGRSVGFGVRLEDPILVSADGGVPMTGSRAKSPYEP